MSENFEAQQFRDELSQKVKEAPKPDRKEVLDKAKETPGYWDARTKKNKERQHEKEIENGLGVLVDKKTIYHGSGISGIKQFEKAEETTVGDGLYCTSQAKDAIGYARVRSGREQYEHRGDGKPAIKDSKPVIYETYVENMKLIDLRKDENVKKVLEGFKEVLQQELKKPSQNWAWHTVIERTIETIKEGKVDSGSLREATFHCPQLFTDYCKSLGYEGLITYEGGEGETGNHDTYLIFDPKRVKINEEHLIL